jgi:hypothetical protein
MSIPRQAKQAFGERFGLAPDAIFRLWRSAFKDDERLIDEAIAATYDRMNSIDPVRAEQVMSLIIRRHADAKNALKDLLSRSRQGPGHSFRVRDPRRRWALQNGIEHRQIDAVPVERDQLRHKLPDLVDIAAYQLASGRWARSSSKNLVGTIKYSRSSDKEV